MFAFRVEYLTGRAVSSRYNDRRVAEWPPHPGRLYAALVAAWAEAESPDDGERDALDWLAEQPPPALYATEASHRGVRRRGPGDWVTPVTHYVPVNDVSVVGEPVRQRDRLEAAEAALAAATEPRARARAQRDFEKAASALEAAIRDSVAAPAAVSKSLVAQGASVLPEHRKRQARTFPSVSPVEPVVWMRWDVPLPEAHRAALAALAGRVARLGHSSSLVACSLTDTAPPPNLVPDPDGPEVLRVPGPGQRARLEEAHARHLGMEPRVTRLRFARYAVPREVAATKGPLSVLAGDWIVLRRVGGPRLPATAGVAVARAVRAALMAHADQPVHELISGHAPDGTRSRLPHLAIVPLPDVGHPHADGALLGVALVIPGGADPGGRRAALRALGRWEEHQRGAAGHEEADAPPLPVRLGASGVLELERVVWGEPPRHGLRANTWSGPARVWVSVTPVALDRNPGALDHRNPDRAAAAWAEAEAALVAACGRLGLPAPVRVVGSLAPQLPGSMPARAFPPFPPDVARLRRVKVHARLEFAEPVGGPLLLGAGRFFGLGLFRPLREGLSDVR